jgi:hypothetical protein
MTMIRGLGGLSQVGGYCKVDGEAIYMVGKKKVLGHKKGCRNFDDFSQMTGNG